MRVLVTDKIIKGAIKAASDVTKAVAVTVSQIKDSINATAVLKQIDDLGTGKILNS